MEREVRFIMRASRKNGSPEQKTRLSLRFHICAGCGERLERFGKELAAFGKRLRNAAEAEKARIAVPEI